MPYDNTSWVEISCTENVSKEPSATVVYVGPYAERIAFMRQMYGRLTFGGFVPPTIYGPLGIFCQSCTSKPYGKASAEGEWETAEVTVNFGANNDEPTNENGEPADIADEKITVAGQTITLPQSLYKWLGGEKNGKTLTTDDAAPFMVIPEIGYTITRHYVTDYDPDRLTQYVGKTNSTGFGPRSLAAGRVMYLGSGSERKLTSEGLRHHKVDYNFSIKGTGQNWNKFWDGSSWQFIGHGTSNDKVYQEADLNNVF
jgi:hypothetical protein